MTRSQNQTLRKPAARVTVPVGDVREVGAIGACGNSYALSLGPSVGGDKLFRGHSHDATISSRYQIGNTKRLPKEKTRTGIVLSVDINEIRLKNFEALVTGFARGSLKEFERKSGLSAVYLSHLRNRRRVIGQKTARKLELACGKPDGWLDSPEDTSPSGRLQAIISQLPPEVVAQVADHAEWLLERANQQGSVEQKR